MYGIRCVRGEGGGTKMTYHYNEAGGRIEKLYPILLSKSNSLISTDSSGAVLLEIFIFLC